MLKSIALIAGTNAIIIGKPAQKEVTAKDIICKFAATKRTMDEWYAYMDTEHHNRLSLQDFQTALQIELSEAGTDWTAEWADQMNQPWNDFAHKELSKGEFVNFIDKTCGCLECKW